MKSKSFALFGHKPTILGMLFEKLFATYLLCNTKACYKHFLNDFELKKTEKILNTGHNLTAFLRANSVYGLMLFLNSIIFRNFQLQKEKQAVKQQLSMVDCDEPANHQSKTIFIPLDRVY